MPLSNFSPSRAFAENAVNASPQLLDPDVTFTSSTSLSGGRLIVTGLLPEDRISILSQGDGAGQIGVSGSTIRYGGVSIGATSSIVGVSLTVVINASASAAAVDALIQRIAYGNVSNTPTATRDLTLDVQDGAGRGLGFGIGTLAAQAGAANPFNGIDVGFYSAPAFVDLNGDGLLDLVSGTSTGTFLAWRNTGTAAAPVFTALTGNANPFSGFLIAGGLSTPAFVDLDGDGDLDLVAGEQFGTLLTWRNTGSAAAPVYSLLTGAANPFTGIDVVQESAPAFVDLDGDGDLDLVLGMEGVFDSFNGIETGTLQVWRRSGSAAAPVFTALTGAANPFDGINVKTHSAPAFIDLDGDGDLDLVSGEGFGALLVWRNTGSAAAPVFTSGANPFSGIDAGSTSKPAFADLDSDGDLDLVLGQSEGALLTWRNTAPLPRITVTVTAENEGVVITSAPAIKFRENTTGTAYGATGFDAFGPVTWSLSGTDAALFDIDSATGAVRFKAVPDFEAPADAGRDNVYNFTLGASDSARTVSQAVAITVTNVVEAGRLTGFGPNATFAENTVNAGPRLLDASVDLTPSDLLSGGLLVVSGLLAEDRVSILSEGTGPGQIGVSGTSVSYGGVTLGVAAGGVGGDFTVSLDATATAAAVEALIQRLAYANISDTPTETRDLTVNVTSSAGAGLGQGIGTLTEVKDANPFQDIDVGFGSAPAFVDLDNDGDLDLVSGRYEAGQGDLRVWSNTGTGLAPVFTERAGADNPFNGLGAGGYSAPAFVDLNGDGLLDLVAGSQSGPLRAWLNTGTAVAPAFNALNGGANPFNGFLAGAFSMPAFVDLNGDGRLDLVVGAEDGTLRSWMNTGTTAAPAFTALTGAANPFAGIDVGADSSPAFVDLDGDGDLDLVAGNADRSFTAWTNTGTAAAPAFSLPGSELLSTGFSGSSGRQAPAFVDIDGDGDLDLVVGHQRGTLLLYRNAAPLPKITVTVTAESDPPVITSAALASVAENTTDDAYQSAALAQDGPTTFTWSLTGADAALFTIDPATGAVRFATPPDFEAPADAGGDNVYDVIVRANDGTTTGSGSVAITVTDVLEGGSGDDIIDVGAGDQNADGGLGIDTASFASAAAGVFYNLFGQGTAFTTQGGGIDTLAGFENLTGSPFGDTLEGDTGPNLLDGGDGDDLLNGSDGNDTLEGGAGNNMLDGSTGRDTAVFQVASSVATIAKAGDGTWTVSSALGTDILRDIELLQFTDRTLATPGTAVRNDLDGSGTADILWRNADGTVALWQLTGFTGTGAAFAGVTTDWTIADTGDFNGDGRADILWRNADGTLAEWWMDGTTYLGGGSVAVVDPAWQVAATGDLNGDGYADILFRLADGTVAGWLMDGLTVLAAGTIAAPGAAWKVIDAVDFSGDGSADILWRNDNGQVELWRMDGLAFQSSATLASPGAAWTVVGTGDLNGDSHADLLWRNADGTVAGWLMNDASFLAAATIANPGPDWTVAGNGDYDGDGRADILWRNADGNVALWLMDGLTPSEAEGLGNPGTDWQVA